MEIKLIVPAERKGCTDWILSQTPDVVADILTVAEGLFQITSSLGSIHDSQSMSQLASHHQRERSKLEARLEDLRDQLRDVEEDRENRIAISVRHQVELMTASFQRQLDIQTELHKQNVDAVRLAADAELSRLRTELESARSTDCRALLDESTKLLKQFTKENKSGYTGENLVRKVFDEQINNGFLEDTSRSTEMGSEDYVWSLKDVKTTIEVKWKSAMHSRHDMQKHTDRIYEARRMGKINMGIFFSLLCGIPNKPPICIERVSGVPVLYVSRIEGTSPASAIAMGFRIATALAEQLDAHDPTDAIMSEQIVRFFDKAITALNKQDSIILTMRRNMNQCFKALENMQRLRSEMISDIEAMRTDYPTLSPTEDAITPNAAASDQTDCDPVAIVTNYLNLHRRYPTSREQVPTLPGHLDLDEVVKQTKRLKRKA